MLAKKLVEAAIGTPMLAPTPVSERVLAADKPAIPVYISKIVIYIFFLFRDLYFSL